MLQQLLSSVNWGYSTHWPHLPDLIVLDLMQPGMDVLSVCRELKTSGKTRDIPTACLCCGMTGITLAGIAQTLTATRAFRI